MACSHGASAVLAQFEKGKRGGCGARWGGPRAPCLTPQRRLKEEEANVLTGVATVGCLLSLAHALLPRKEKVVASPPVTTGRKLSVFDEAKKKADESKRRR